MAGAPSSEIVALPEPERLYVPLQSRRFEFTRVLVEEGQRVAAGDALAVDPARFDVPLLAPRGGTARLDEAEGHIVLEGLEPARESVPAPAADTGSGVSTRRLLELGVWQFFSDARTREPVDPAGTPAAVIATTLRLEPFLAGGEAQLEGALERLTRGLSHLRELASAAPLYVVVPDADQQLAADIRAAASRCPDAHVVSVPLRFPFDDPALLARYLKLPSVFDVTVWALSTEGVLAVDAALSEGRPCVERAVSVAGPAIEGPVHVSAVIGHPIEQILEGRVRGECARVVNGGLLTGEALPVGRRGLDAECTGLTVLSEPDTQMLIAFARPGVADRSYSRTFVGTLRTDMGVSYRAGLSGEVRPCVSCGLCAEVCPAGILPALIHKQLYAHKLEEAQRLRVDLCVGCGLCSFVCPSKIDLRSGFLRAVDALCEEAALVRAEAEAAAAEAAAAEAEKVAAGSEGVAAVVENAAGEEAQ